jgi:hypothetical protein
MSEESGVWELYKGETKLGLLSAYGWFDFPWIGCQFEQTPEFEQYRYLFDEAAKLIEHGWSERLEEIHDEINSLFRLISVDNSPSITEFGLYIDGENTRLRAIFEDKSDTK